MKVFAVCSLAVVVCCAMACTSKKAAYKNVVKQDSLLLYEVPLDMKDITAEYSGDFKGSPIAISLDYIAGKRVCGHDIHKGLRRNISGSIMLEGGKLHLVMQEPGTNEYDGTFDMWLDTFSKKIEGKWKPLSGGEHAATAFNLVKGDSWSSSYFADSTGAHLSLLANSSCEFYYVVNEGTDTAQTMKFSGNYQVAADSSTITCFWQPNEVFPTRNTVFKLSKRTESEGMELLILQLENWLFEEEMY